MEFIKFIRSVEEFLYELTTWLIFYPRTLWRALRHPLLLTAQAEVEMARDDAHRFASLISPPLFLILSVLVAWIAESALHMGAVKLAADRALAQQILDAPTNLLAYRAASFSLFPLAMALGVVRLRREAIDRQTLRRPFYLQCFLVGPFVLASSIAADLLRLGSPRASAVAAGLALLWFVAVETAWFRSQFGLGLLKALVTVFGLSLAAVVAVVVLAAALVV
jgi:hypothetical protein